MLTGYCVLLNETGIIGKHGDYIMRVQKQCSVFKPQWPLDISGTSSLKAFQSSHKASGSASLIVRYQKSESYQLHFSSAYDKEQMLSAASERVLSGLFSPPDAAFQKGSNRHLSLALSINAAIFQVFALTAFFPLSYWVKHQLSLSEITAVSFWCRILNHKQNCHWASTWNL